MGEVGALRTVELEKLIVGRRSLQLLGLLGGLLECVRHGDYCFRGGGFGSEGFLVIWCFVEVGD